MATKFPKKKSSGARTKQTARKKSSGMRNQIKPQ
jgi:hypothetical protein